MTYVPLGEWTPDSPQHILSTISDLHNMMPDTSAYSSVPSFKPMSLPLLEDGEPAKVTGSAAFISGDGIIYTFCGTDKGLYKLEGAEWVNVSNEGGYNGLGERWQFTMYGNYVLATNYQDPIQVYDLSLGGTFEVMSESAPRCRTMAIVNEFLFLGDTVDDYDGERQGRVWWSPIADPRGTWEPNQTTMCDYQDLGQGVSVVRVVGGDAAKIFMRTAVIRGTFVGSPTVFQFDVIESARGCVGINALTNIGETIYFMSYDGVYALNADSDIPIGINKVDRFILNEISGSLLTFSQCAVDYRHKIIWWVFPDPKYSTGEELIFKEAILYHYPSKKWGRATVPMVSLHSFYTKGYTLDELDIINEKLDELPFPLDSIMYKGGVPVVGSINEQGQLCYGYGTPLDAYVVTGDAPYGEHDERTFIRRVRPTLDGTSTEHTMSISGKQTLSQEDNFTAPTGLTRLGDFACRKSARYHKIRFDLTGDWTQISGYSVIADKEGTQ